MTYSTVNGALSVTGASVAGELSDTTGIAVCRSLDGASLIKTNGILNIRKMSDVAGNYTWGYEGISSMAPTHAYTEQFAGVTTASESLPNLVFTTSNGVETMTGTACISYRG